MADEYSKSPGNRAMPIPAENNWESLVGKNSDEFESITANCCEN